LNAGKAELTAATSTIESSSDGGIAIKLSRNGKQVIIQLQPDAIHTSNFTVSRA
jgi:hypothetical protein